LNGEIVKLPENICQACKKREATKLCDKVKGEYKWAGHPPRSTRVISHTKQAFSEPLTGTITCDRMLCDKCATNITGMDLCPRCLSEIKMALKKKALK
jgi:hypothetical protein